MNITMRLDLGITFQCLREIWENSKSLIKSTNFNHTRDFSVKRKNHRCLGLPEVILVCGSGAVDKITKHNRNIYTDSGMSVSIQLLNFLMAYIQKNVAHVWKRMYLYIHKGWWHVQYFLLCYMFWCLCTCCLFVCALCVMSSVFCCEAARHEQCVATGKILSLN